MIYKVKQIILQLWENVVVGETVLKLDDQSKMQQLEEITETVKAQFDLPIIPLIITHFAHPALIEKVREKGIIVVQSFEWDW